MAAPRELRIADYDYALPDGQIARHPCEPRDACRLLVRRAPGQTEHHTFTDLPGLLEPGSLMVCNNTRVINARIRMRKPTGAEIEIFCLEPDEPRDYAQAFQAKGSCRWVCLVGNVKRWKSGELHKECAGADGVRFTLSASLGGEAPGGARYVSFRWEPDTLTFADVIAAAGFIPIPPYLCRQSEQSDSVDYQTVYSKIKGSVAAPTAGLHFTDTVLEAIRAKGVETRELTLHVGAGTFQPVKSDTIGEHPMHTETVCIDRPLLGTLIAALDSGRRVTAVGTTTVRTLESLPHLGRRLPELHVGQWDAYADDFDTLEALCSLAAYMDSNALDHLTATTAIMIAPGYRWRVVDSVVTNFHQPQSTLLLLVASWLDAHSGAPSEWRAIYEEAVRLGYRFLSYGDSMLLSAP